jgi:hypothetical protein
VGRRAALAALVGIALIVGFQKFGVDGASALQGHEAIRIASALVLGVTRPLPSELTTKNQIHEVFIDEQTEEPQCSATFQFFSGFLRQPEVEIYGNIEMLTGGNNSPGPEVSCMKVQRGIRSFRINCISNVKRCEQRRGAPVITKRDLWHDAIVGWQCSQGLESVASISRNWSIERSQLRDIHNNDGLFDAESGCGAQIGGFRRSFGSSNRSLHVESLLISSRSQSSGLSKEAGSLDRENDGENGDESVSKFEFENLDEKFFYRLRRFGLFGVALTCLFIGMAVIKRGVRFRMVGIILCSAGPLILLFGWNFL